ncbi:methyltransferase [Candidatus Woesearchaeota archaeon]|nr:methyltransferase [Candidatus Woesearchaeota archaeon]
MNSCKSIYDHQEDSTMLEKWVRKYAKGKVLDVGTGSGIQAIAAAQNAKVKSVLATDVQKDVIDYCNANIKNHKIKFVHSDLFQKVRGKFDTVIFNPPYLPQELKLKDLTIEGGKKGYEVIEKFLNDANNFLAKDGIILMVFSSLTNKEKVEGFIRNNLLDFEELEKAHIFFEDIHIYLLKKNELLKRLELKDVSNVKYLTKGHRGFLFTGNYRNKKIAVKIKNPKSTAFGRIENEAKWLEKLNKCKIGPKVCFHEDGYFACDYSDGSLIVDYLEKSGKAKIKKILKKIFDQAYKLDKSKIDKEEMHHPVKHIIVSGSNPVFLDFERAHYSQSPKNVTQFCQFLIGKKIIELLRGKGMKIDKGNMISLAKIYKNEQTRKNLKKIMDAI